VVLSPDDRLISVYRNDALNKPESSTNGILVFLPSPLTGEGQDEGGFDNWYPSPYPLPQGERICFEWVAKFVPRNDKLMQYQKFLAEM
jgi:hypothetical protein